MKKQHLLFAVFILAGCYTVSAQTSDTADSLLAQRALTIDEVVGATGTRNPDGYTPLIADRFSGEQGKNRAVDAALPAPGAHGTGSGAVHHFARRDGLRCLERSRQAASPCAGSSGGNARLMVLIDGHPQ